MQLILGDGTLIRLFHNTEKQGVKGLPISLFNDYEEITEISEKEEENDVIE